MIVWCTWSNTTETMGGLEDRKQDLYNQCQYCSARLEVIHRVVGSGLKPLLCSLVCKGKVEEFIFSSDF